ncbi:hypothetical protein RyT2_01310 [Pseudolactococcus yaeyamensis]
MVIYDSGDSSNLITALEANLSGAQQIFDRLSKGSQHLIGVIDSGTLSGAAYKAGQTLFVVYINPMLQKLNQAITDIQGDLKSYKTADSAISAVGNHLDSDQIQQLLKLTQNMIDLVEQKIKDDRDFINQFFSGGFEKVGNALAELPDLYDQLENLKEIKATRKKELKALETFSSSTHSLFQDSLRAFENAMKGVDVINRSTASSDGTITFPAGADMSWATKLSAEKFSSDLSGAKSKKKSDKIEIKWSAMNGMGESFPTVYVNGKVDNEKTKDLRLAINKMGWANLKKLAPELIVELIGVNDVKTLLDTDASFSKQSLSFLSLLLTYFPLKKAVSLYKAMEAARLLEKGGDLALDLAKISKTFGLTEKEAKVLSEMWDAEKISSKFSSELEMLDPNKINHIMLSKHDWIKVVNPPTWENVKPLMEEVLKKGKDTVVKGIPAKELTIDGKTITVTYVEMNGKVRISNAWVNY